MCGIVGYAGGRPALGIVLDGLRRLEYRGYDSAGVAVVSGGALLTEKRARKLANLEKALAQAGGARGGGGTTPNRPTPTGPPPGPPHPHTPPPPSPPRPVAA